MLLFYRAMDMIKNLNSEEPERPSTPQNEFANRYIAPPLAKYTAEQYQSWLVTLRDEKEVVCSHPVSLISS